MLERTRLVGARFVDEGRGEEGAWQVRTSPEVEGLPPMDLHLLRHRRRNQLCDVAVLADSAKEPPDFGLRGGSPV